MLTTKRKKLRCGGGFVARKTTPRLRASAVTSVSVLSAILLMTACADRSGCSHDAPIGTTLLTSPGDTLFKATAPDTFIAKFTTGRGDFFVQVVREWAPLGADRFYNL